MTPAAAPAPRPPRPRRTRLGWLGPAIVLVGLAVGSLGVWWMLRARPAPGAVIDTIAPCGGVAGASVGSSGFCARALEPGSRVVVRHEAKSERAMIELVRGDDTVAWQALIPPYAGRPGAPGVAAAKNAISVRVVRTRPELWVMSTRDATKLGAIGLDEYAPGGWNRTGTSQVVTAGDGVRSYEVIDGVTGTAVVAVDLERGAVIWHRDLPGPVRTVTVTPAGKVEVAMAEQRVQLDAVTGRE